MPSYFPFLWCDSFKAVYPASPSLNTEGVLPLTGKKVGREGRYFLSSLNPQLGSELFIFMDGGVKKLLTHTVQSKGTL